METAMQSGYDTIEQSFNNVNAKIDKLESVFTDTLQETVSEIVAEEVTKELRDINHKSCKMDVVKRQLQIWIIKNNLSKMNRKLQYKTFAGTDSDMLHIIYAALCGQGLLNIDITTCGDGQGVISDLYQVFNEIADEKCGGLPRPRECEGGLLGLQLSHFLKYDGFDSLSNAISTPMMNIDESQTRRQMHEFFKGQKIQVRLLYNYFNH